MSENEHVLETALRIQCVPEDNAGKATCLVGAGCPGPPLGSPALQPTSQTLTE